MLSLSRWEKVLSKYEFKKIYSILIQIEYTLTATKVTDEKL